MFGWSQKDKDNSLRKILSHRLRTYDCGKLEKVLAKGGNPDTCDQYGRPLICIAARGSADTSGLEAVRILLKAGVEIDATGENGRTALHYAACGGVTETVEILLEAGFDVAHLDDDDRPPLFYALSYGYEQLSALLIEKGALDEMTDEQCSALLCAGAACYNDIALLEKILSRIAHVGNASLHDECPLHVAVAQEQVRDDVFTMLASRTDINLDRQRANDGNTILMTAVQYEHAEIVEKLLAAGAGAHIANSSGQQPLYYAVGRGSVRMVDALIKSNAEPAGQPRLDLESALIYAARSGHGRILELLIEAGAQVDFKGNNGQTALMAAAGEDCVEAVGILLKAGANIDITDNNGKTAHDHTRMENSRAAKALLEKEMKRVVVAAALAQKADDPFIKLSDVEIEVRHGKGLALVFNFWTQQMIYRDAQTSAIVGVTNFDDVQRHEAVEEAYHKLKEKGGKPPELRVLGKAIAAGLK